MERLNIMANDRNKHPYHMPEKVAPNKVVHGGGDSFAGGATGPIPKKHRGHRMTHHSGHSYEHAIPGHKDGHHGNKGHKVNHSHKHKNHDSHHHGAFKYHGGEDH